MFCLLNLITMGRVVCCVGILFKLIYFVSRSGGDHVGLAQLPGSILRPQRVICCRPWLYVYGSLHSVPGGGPICIVLFTPEYDLYWIV